MSRTTFEEIRAPVALVLLLIAAFVLWPRGEEQEITAASPSPSPRPSVVVGEPGGEVLPPSVAATPIPTAAVAATPTPTPEVDTFSAEVLVCRSISESRCDDEIRRLGPNTDSITALVRFTDANAGDTINAILAGPGGTIPGGEYALEGGGDGYYYSTFQAANLPRGEYTVTATRNGVEIATTSFRKVGR